jgi:hypothetical protein
VIGRSSGRSAIPRWIASAAAAGSSGRCSRASGGSPERIRCMTSKMFAPGYGRRPVSISKATVASA